jgi:hypothetical protein
MFRCKSCKSKHVFITERHTKLCTECGIEIRHSFAITPIHVSYNACHHQPFAEGYNRKKRFHNMLLNIIFGGCSTADENMIKHLERFNHYVTEACLLKQMKKSKLRDKRYTSLHLFSKLFLPSYRKPVMPSNWNAVDRSIVRLFLEIELVHHRIYSKPFFSYVWLLQKILICHGLEQFCRYIKQLKCPRRVKLYEEDFSGIMAKLSQTSRYLGARVCAAMFPKLPVECTDGPCPHRARSLLRRFRE